jgi:TolB protein
MSGAGLREVPLTGIPELNNDHVLAPDGSTIFLSANDGHIYRTALTGGPAARITEDSSRPEQLLTSGTVGWFPHPSPDGTMATCIRFPSGTAGHPADLPVDVVLVSTGNWATPLNTWPLFGGQGTLNVNSWAPDSARFAFVAYPLAGSDSTKDQRRDDSP